jgi:hypothetical protein
MRSLMFAKRNSLCSSTPLRGNYLTWFVAYFEHAEENLTPEEFFLRGLDHDFFKTSVPDEGDAR